MYVQCTCICMSVFEWTEVHVVLYTGQHMYIVHVHVHAYNVHVHVHVHKHTHTQCTVPLAGYPVKLQPSLFRKAMAFSTFPLRANDDEGFLSTNGISEFAMRRYMYMYMYVYMVVQYTCTL